MAVLYRVLNMVCEALPLMDAVDSCCAAFQQYATGNPVHGGSGHGHSRLPGDEV